MGSSAIAVATASSSPPSSLSTTVASISCSETSLFGGEVFCFIGNDRLLSLCLCVVGDCDRRRAGTFGKEAAIESECLAPDNSTSSSRSSLCTDAVDGFNNIFTLFLGWLDVGTLNFAVAVVATGPTIEASLPPPVLLLDDDELEEESSLPSFISCCRCSCDAIFQVFKADLQQ